MIVHVRPISLKYKPITRSTSDLTQPLNYTIRYIFCSGNTALLQHRYLDNKLSTTLGMFKLKNHAISKYRLSPFHLYLNRIIPC